jgi:hypothetical protein
MEHQRTGVLECWSNGVMERVKEKKGVELEIVLIRSTPILQYSNFLGGVFSMKAAIVGCGFVGSTAAYAITLEGAVPGAVR